MSKEIENILFSVYEKGVKQEDCDLTEIYEKLIQLLKPKEDEIEDRTADIDEDMPGEFVKIKEDE